MARLIVTKAQEWCRKNFEMTCYGDHFALVFYSGARENKFVVQLVRGEIHVDVVGESTRMWLERSVQECWDWFKGVVVHIWDKAPHAALVGGALRAIGW